MMVITFSGTESTVVLPVNYTYSLLLVNHSDLENFALS